MLKDEFLRGNFNLILNLYPPACREMQVKRAILLSEQGSEFRTLASEKG